MYMIYFSFSLIRDKNKWGKWILLLISHNAPVKVWYQSLIVWLQVLYYPLLSYLITIWRCSAVFFPLIFGPYKQITKVSHFKMINGIIESLIRSNVSIKNKMSWLSITNLPLLYCLCTALTVCALGHLLNIPSVSRPGKGNVRVNSLGIIFRLVSDEYVTYSNKTRNKCYFFMNWVIGFTRKYRPL